MRRKAVSDVADRQARKASWHGKAFLVEALVLLVFLVASLSILVALFVQARTEADEGERLSQAVQLAQNAAEEFAADPAGSQGLAIEDGGLVATVQVGEEAHESGSLLNATVTVVDEEGGGSIEAGEEIYRLDTARYVPGFEGGLPNAGASAGASLRRAPAPARMALTRPPILARVRRRPRRQKAGWSRWSDVPRRCAWAPSACSRW